MFHELIGLIEIIYKESKDLERVTPVLNIGSAEIKAKILGGLCLKLAEKAREKIAEKEKSMQEKQVQQI